MRINKLKSTSSKALEYLAIFPVIIILVVSAILLYGIIAEDIELAEWQRKIENNEVNATTATVIDRRIIEYQLVTGRTGGRTTVVLCSFDYAYEVNGSTYRASDTYRGNLDSLCYHRDIVKIKIFYDPQNIVKSISAKMGHEGRED